jgi:N-acyl-phosphatidylethanolamine-hydrolysing phospholipase D
MCLPSVCLGLSACLLVAAALMGAMSSRSWTPGADLANWAPEPWPVDHTDDRGRAESFQDSAHRWQNPWMAGRPSVASFFYDWFVVGRDESAIPSAAQLDETLPVRRPVWATESGWSPQQARMTWLGHATVLFELEGSTFLCDPVFSARASAVQLVGPRRYRDAACQARDLPKLTAVLVSHNHYDHLDLNSVKQLVTLQPDISWFVPSGMAEWMRANTGVAEGRVKELVWWQEAALAGEGGTNFTVALTPANHWCKRGVNDDNMVLWGSWTVMGPNKRFWFGGDTGYCEAFAQIGKQYGPFDMAAIPIGAAHRVAVRTLFHPGAYQPNWFMRYQHVHPGEAVQVHQDVRRWPSLPPLPSPLPPAASPWVSTGEPSS